MDNGNFLIDKDSATLAGTGALCDTPRKSYRSHRAKLQTVSDCAHEAARLYREARAGKIKVEDASRLGNLLSIVSRMLGDSEFEKRIEALEQKGRH